MIRIKDKMKKGIDYIGCGVGAVIINEENDILLLQRRKDPESGYWSIPGGSVEFGETIKEAIIREVKEELGVDCKIESLLGVTNHILQEKTVHWIAPTFLVKITNGIPRNVEPQAHSEVKWFNLEELPEHITLTTSNALEFYYSREKAQ